MNVRAPPLIVFTNKDNSIFKYLSSESHLMLQIMVINISKWQVLSAVEEYG